MTLTNIEYGSLASSDVMNSNFNYLNEKIEEASANLSTNLSSVLSNIASINLKLNNLSSELADAVLDFDSKLLEIKNKTQIALNTASMSPDWLNLVRIADLTNYEVEDNGFLLLQKREGSIGDLSINSLKMDAISDYAGTFFLPVKKGDVIISTLEYEYIYLIPSTGFTLDDK